MNFIKIVKFDFINILRNPTLIVANTVIPLVLIGVMGFVTKGLYTSGSVSSFDYYGVTMIILSAFMICLTASNTFMEEKVKKGNARIVYAPVTKTQIYLSKFLATYILGLVSYTTLLLAGQFLFHINFGGKNLLYIILLVNMLVLFGCCLGIMFCCIFRSEEGANSIMQIFVMLFVFFGSIFFPVAGLGKLVDKLSWFSPIKWVTECTFRVIYDNDFGIYLPTLAIVLSCSILCIMVCQIIFKPEEYV